ncbi:MAG: rod shape-determining protein MreD [Thermoleophilia bacterium]|nr:MAG: rod shape-determining protein MreD [Thermoleophilia bacterium]
MNTPDNTFDVADGEVSDDYGYEADDQRTPGWISGVALPLVSLMLAIYLQIALAIDARVLGAVANFTLVVVVAFALRYGPAWGAVVGFISGLLLDIALQAPLGMSALVLTPIGWGVGVFAQRRRRVSLAMAVTVLLISAIVCSAVDIFLTTVITGDSIAWSTIAIAGTAGALLTLLAGIILLPCLRRLMGVPLGGNV